mmetsp:Transcript_33289/g.76711  ORF Transcript_33289/g.76711 Transcript_33289/m.76711 type:complete len:109 (+) Transcript_33289:465-791(+)
MTALRINGSSCLSLLFSLWCRTSDYNGAYEGRVGRINSQIFELVLVPGPIRLRSLRNLVKLSSSHEFSTSIHDGEHRLCFLPKSSRRKRNSKVFGGGSSGCTGGTTCP